MAKNRKIPIRIGSSSTGGELLVKEGDNAQSPCRGILSEIAINNRPLRLQVVHGFQLTQ
jgi:hypothetical protein